MSAGLADYPSVARQEQSWNGQHMAQPVCEPSWRLWAYDESAAVLGCSQRRLLSSARHDFGVEVLMRRSGGGAVLAGPWMLGLSVVLPAGHALAANGPMASYRWLGELLAGVIQDAGISASALPPEALRRTGRTPPAVPWACFGALSPWEVAVDGRKIAGLAQVRGRHGVLLAGGVLLEPPPWAMLCAVLNQDPGDAPALAQAATSWAEEAGAAVTANVLRDALSPRLSALREAPHSTPPDNSAGLSNISPCCAA